MRSKVARRILQETPEETKVFVTMYADILVRVKQLMKEKQMSQKALAQKLNKQPSEINKWLSGKHNLTLKTIAKLQTQFTEPIFYIPRATVFTSKDAHKSHFLVYRNRPIPENTEFKDYAVNGTLPKTYQPIAHGQS
jgi:transcriptional regulator with XRE-family HTH domain